MRVTLPVSVGVSVALGCVSALSGVVIIVVSVAVMNSGDTLISFTVSTGALSGTVRSVSFWDNDDFVCMDLSEEAALTIGASSDVVPFCCEGFLISVIIATWSLSDFDEWKTDVLQDCLLVVALAK